MEGKVFESRGDALESLQYRVEPYAGRPMRLQKKRSPHFWFNPGRKQSGEAGKDVGSREAQGVEGIGRCTGGAIIGGCSLGGGSAAEATGLDDVQRRESRFQQQDLAVETPIPRGGVVISAKQLACESNGVRRRRRDRVALSCPCRLRVVTRVGVEDALEISRFEQIPDERCGG